MDNLQERIEQALDVEEHKLRLGDAYVMQELIRDMQARIGELESENKIHYECADSVKTLVREIDVIMHGDNAAPQVALCDLVALIRKREQDTSKDKLVAALADLVKLKDCVNGHTLGSLQQWVILLGNKAEAALKEAQEDDRA